VPVGKYAVRLSMAVAGAVDTGVDTRRNSAWAGGSWLSVRTGPVLCYCEHPADATGRARRVDHRGGQGRADPALRGPPAA
jgi:hypothetical protein